MYWVTNSDGSLHTHLDVSCYPVIMLSQLQYPLGIFPEIIPTGLDVCRQQLPHEDHWEMLNPLIGYDNLHYHNHDPDDNVDEEWFQGRDGWD